MARPAESSKNTKQPAAKASASTPAKPAKAPAKTPPQPAKTAAKTTSKTTSPAAKADPAKAAKRPAAPAAKAPATPAARPAQAAAQKIAPKATPKTAARSATTPPSLKETPAVKKAATAASAQPTSPAQKGAAAPARNGQGAAVPAVVVKGEKDGIAWTKDFDFKFLSAQRAILIDEREQLVGQASRLEDEANALIEEHEMGDVQFDEESGEGDTMAVERERDLALSSQARQMVADIDAALERMVTGTYGYSVVSGTPIPRDRLEAIPWATELVEEKVGGLGRR